MIRAQSLTPAFTFQGELALSTGPATGSFDMQFRLFDSATSSGQVGSTVTANAVSVQAGLFAVSLDFGPAQFAGDRQWLEIGIRPSGSGNYETLSPRTEVTATPYAWGAAVALANSVTTTSLVDSAVQAADVAAGAIGTIQINASQVQRRIGGTCSGSQGVQSVNADGSVVCGSFTGGAGTVTSVATGAGLTGGPISTSGTIAIAPGGIGATQINASQVQARIAAGCAVGSAIRDVAADGRVTCETALQGPVGPAGPVNITYVNATALVNAGNGFAQVATCPANTVVVGGSCGYIQLDAGLFDMKVAYAGISGRSNYRCVVHNTGSVPRLLTYGAICTTASTVTGASAPEAPAAAPAAGAIEH